MIHVALLYNRKLVKAFAKDTSSLYRQFVFTISYVVLEGTLRAFTGLVLYFPIGSL